MVTDRFSARWTRPGSRWTMAERIGREFRHAHVKASEEECERGDVERSRERDWGRRVSCPRCDAPAGRACQTSSGARAAELHKGRREAAGPMPVWPSFMSWPHRAGLHDPSAAVLPAVTPPIVRWGARRPGRA
ncbi:zinc finger domain-containing protein [Sphaerisporangium siamense]|uniref:zinc finger domain-containing protein n=1 Tax=Sphaerisporangium siamense TaxID=795645 RepID=UPI00403AA415